MSYEGMSDKGTEVLSFLEKGASDGLSGAEVLRTLRAEGLGYSTQTFYNDYSRVLTAQENFAGMKHIRTDSMITERWYAGAKTPLVTGRYQTVMEMRGIDRATGEAVTRHVTVSHDELITRQQAEDDALSWTDDYDEDVEYTQILPVKARKSVELR